ncbi:DUF6985 domain-containing protein [Photobacterium nomapromontoriensis]|uniref:DUF6985 domain-containing protein n=1 Tax=Photobacterium nomapromontoriensis TaxID=2910237 RepID=UPI003D0B9E18
MNNNLNWVRDDEHLHITSSELTKWHDFKGYHKAIDFCSGEDFVEVDDMMQWFSDNEVRVYSILCDYLKEEYQEILEESEFLDVFDDEPTIKTRMGVLTKEQLLAGNISELMAITRFTLHSVAKNAISVSFECAWDEEHGIGFVIQGDDVLYYSTEHDVTTDGVDEE